MSPRSLIAVAACAVSLLLGTPTGAAFAQAYPDKPITVIVPSSAGGPADVAIRLVNERLSAALGQPLVIETIAGAGGTIGMARVARAAPDGYTLLIHQTGFAITPAIYAKLNFDTAKDFVTVGLVNTSSTVLVGRGDIPAGTYQEFLAWARGPGKPIKHAHPGPGTTGHLFTVMHTKIIGAETSVISYRGIAPAVNDLLGGHIDIASVGTAVATPLIKSGKLKVFATTGVKRITALPDVPTFGEVGHPELQREFWHALFAPVATPRPILEKLNAALNETLNDPKVIELYAKSSVEAHPANMRTLEAAHKYVLDELTFYGKVVRDNNVKVD
jgi:tripartite-type tricarboxylate transporter receptor subunit TctC